MSSCSSFSVAPCSSVSSQHRMAMRQATSSNTNNDMNNKRPRASIDETVEIPSREPPTSTELSSPLTQSAQSRHSSSGGHSSSIPGRTGRQLINDSTHELDNSVYGKLEQKIETLESQIAGCTAADQKEERTIGIAIYC